MSGSEMAGDLVDAALVAHAVEPHRGAAPADDGHSHETACLNCGTALTGPFCSQCGQAAHVHRTLGAFFHDLLHGVFHFEGRVWHTLPMLVLRPGQLTRRYIDGQRARFVSPLALFLFCVFVMFAVIQQTDSRNAVSVDTPDGHTLHGLPAVTARLNQLDAERRAEVARHDDTDDTDTEIAALRKTEALMKGNGGHDTGLPQTTTGLSFLDAMIDKVRDNPELVIYKVQMHAYKYSWLLIPISVPFVWLLFPFDRRFPMYDHTVFVTYSLSFMTLLSVVAVIAETIGWGEGLLALVPPWHMYRQLRGAYGCSRGGAIVRTIGLLMFAGIALAIFASVIVAQSTD